MEHSPADCHRHQLICGPHFPDAVHVFEGGLHTAADLTGAMDSPVEITLMPTRWLACWR
jgi:hypothetical protein